MNGPRAYPRTLLVVSSGRESRHDRIVLGRVPNIYRTLSPRPFRRHRCGGFTLLEVLLASALGTVMLLAMWSLLNMYMRIFTEAPAAVEQSQLVRAVVEQISHDLRCVIPPIERPDQPSPVANGSATRDRMASEFSATSTPTPAADLPVRSLGSTSPSSVSSSDVGPASLDGAVGILPPARLIGEPNSLRMEVLEIAPQPNKDEAEADTRVPVERATDDRPTVSKVPALQHVHYELIEAMDATGDSRGETEGILVRRQRVWDAPVEREETDLTAVSSPPSGSSTRMENSDRFDPRSADPSTDDHSWETDPTTFVIPEVSDIALRYYDGSNWSEWWDSRQRGSLPIAVEVVLTLASPQEPERPDSSSTSASSARDPSPKRGDRSSRSETGRRSSVANATEDTIDRHSRRFVICLPVAARRARADNGVAPPVGLGNGAGPFSSDQEALP